VGGPTDAAHHHSLSAEHTGRVPIRSGGPASPQSFIRFSMDYDLNGEPNWKG